MMKSILSRFVAVACLLIFLTPNIAIPAPKRRIALVIGNANYIHGGSLANPVNDARAITKKLENLGFTVLKHENCSQRAMKKAIDAFGRSLKSYDVGLFFYAGHGVQVKGNNYLIPTNAKLDDENDAEYDCVRTGRILAKMESAGTRTNIVILDACRDNPFERSWNRRAKGSGLAFMNAPSGSLIAYSTSPGMTASDGTGKNGRFTSALLHHIDTPNITILQMFQRVRSTVMNESANQQTPWESTSLRGDFYFNPKRGIAVVKSTHKIDTGLNAEQEELEKKRKELARIEAVIEERGRVEAERKKIEAKMTKLLAMSKRPPKPESKKITNSLGMEFVSIKPGSFGMGSPSSEPGHQSNERQHKVTLTKGFYMQTTEVTQGQWKAVMGNNPSNFTNCGDDCPVEKVSWDDAQGFIRKLNQKEGSGKYRLPTEAEWEYTARAGSRTAFANGGISELKCGYDANLDAMGWYCGNSNKTTHQVAQKQPNAWGLYDMHGNVWEWCQDWYKKKLSVRSVIDSTGPSSGSHRVIRGGSCDYNALRSRSATRRGAAPDRAYGRLGFRLALSPSQ
ncbi:MAG: SUMF1/EgtB/PvdO family nonheme iron enzyme [Thermodesulfobacteriota bacterium]|nr:SUMF1/EgtB/PvdO family nonheme iron enzyme [Thermodesulfobacteriota bacterium]